MAVSSRRIYGGAVEVWRRRNVPLLPPANEQQVVQVFDRLQYPLSADVRDLYTTVGGFDDYESDELWSFWSLDRLCRENEGRCRPFVIFADWLIWSHVYCFHYEGTEASSVYISYTGKSLEPHPVAANVPEFLEKLLRNPEEVWA